MPISAFDLFKIGIGPSSSHTVGPMKAARLFATGLEAQGLLERIASVRVDLYGSLGATGRGHGSDKAVILGLMGETPEGVDTGTVEARLAVIDEKKTLPLLGRYDVGFRNREHLKFLGSQSLPFHPNGMKFTAAAADGELLASKVYYSVGGGFVVDEKATGADRIVADETPVPYPFHSGEELLRLARAHGMPISALMMANEQVVAQRGGGPRWPAEHLARDAGVRGARLRARRHPARRPQGAAPCAQASTSSCKAPARCTAATRSR